MIPLSKITGEHSSGTQTKYNRRIPWSQIIGNTSPQEEPKESGGGFLDTAKKLFDFTPVGAVYNFITGSAPHFMGGAVAETAGNAAKRLGQEFPENSWRRRALDTVSDSAQKITDVALKNGRSRVDATDDGSFHDVIANGFMSNFLGSYGNLARMIHSDKSADAMIEASESMANKKRVSTDDLAEYFTNPYGFASDFANLGGSVAATAPFAALAPIGLITRGTAALGGNAITQALINRGLFNAAKIFAGGAPRAVQYGVGAGAAESAIEGGETRGNLLASGASEEEATRASLVTMGKNLPLLLATNTLEGLAFLSPLKGANKLLQIGGRAALNSAQEQYEEFAQEGIQNAARGEPYGWLPWNGAPNQYEAAERVRYPALLLGGFGGAAQALGGRNENQENFERGSQENISNENFANRANKAGQNLWTWASNISGGQMSDGVFNSIVRNAQELGVDPKLALALATAESNGNQDDISPVGAIGVMQLMPETAEGLGVDPYDQEQNIRGGLTYLKQQLDRFNGDWNLAAAAYNAGAGAVEKYGGVPPYSETQNYVARINGFLGESPEYQGGEEALGNEGITYLGENGKGEGKYWVRNPNMNVSTEGMRPESLNALDILGKYYFDHTGKPLILNAGTNGDHATGEFSHANGWKFDIIDQLEGDGALITADYGRGEFLNQFVKYGRSLGLGMNFEGEGTSNVHLDVAVDGTQWDGNGDHAGGFNLDRVRATAPKKSPSKQSPQSQTQRTNQEETSKPLFDINAEDSTTQKLLEKFATERFSKAVDEADAEPVNFFNGMFDDKDKFQNTPKNREAIIERYGDEFSTWSANQNQQNQSQAKPKAQKQNQQENPFDNGFSLKRAVDQLKAKATQERNAPLLLQLNRAENNPAELKNILEQNGVKMQDPVTQNQSPENVLPKKLSSTEKKIKVASAPVKTGNKGLKSRKKQGTALIDLATQNGIEIPNPEVIALTKGSTKAVQKWRDNLMQAGAFKVAAPQTQENSPTLKERARKILEQSAVKETSTKADNVRAAQADEQARQAQERARQESATQSLQAGELAQQELAQTTAQNLQSRQRPEPKPASKTQSVQTAQADAQALQAQEEYRRRQAEQSRQANEQAMQSFGQTQSQSVQRQKQNYGRTTTAVTDSKTKYPVRYKVVEADELNTSHKIEGLGVVPNDDYRGIQPRDRERVGMQHDLLETAKNFDPDLALDTALSVNSGAPIVRNDNVVLNGNGRTIANRYAYENGNGDAYKNALIQNAQNFGLDTNAISKMNRPILVREVVGNLGEEEMRDIAGSTAGGSGMSPSEQANSDATKISPNTIADFAQDEIDFNAPNLSEATKNLATSVLQNIATPAELNGYSDANGQISKAGITRAKNAIAAYAYGKSDVLNRMSESTDDNIKNITAALTNAAPNVAKIRAGMQNDSLHKYDLNFIADAAGKLSDLRNDDKKTVSDYLNEIELGDTGLSAEAREVLSFFDKNKRSTQKISDFIKGIAKNIREQGDPQQGSLFGESEPAPLIDLIKRARQEVESQGEQDLFAQEEMPAPKVESAQEEKKPKRKSKGKWHTIGSANSREDLQKFMQSHGMTVQITPDGKLITSDGKTLSDKIRVTNKGRWQYGYYETADEKHSARGEVDTRIENFVDEKDLTPQQKLLKSFGEKLGVKTIFFRNEDGDFHGAHANGTTYINVNSKMPLGKVFWHESLHWLKKNNADLYDELVKAAGITDAQRDAYLERTERTDLETDEEIDEEILADQFEDVAKRSGLLQSIAGKNRGLVERVVQWLKDTMNKFIDHFRNPQGKLTTEQATRLADEFGRIAKDLVDPNGQKIFRYNRRTHNIELADGRDLDSIKTKHSEKRGAFKFNERPRIDFKTEHALNFSAQGRIQAQENSGTTQVAGTKTMYVKALQHLRNLKNDIKTVLDYGAGLGLGTDAMRENNSDLKIDSYEPNPQRWQGKTPPTFTDNTKIKSQYDTILNTNVLNVVEPEIRNAIVRDIGSLLKVGGKAMITTRSWKGDIEKTKNYTLGDEPHSVWITRSVGGKPVRVYQKGFDGNELLDYVSDLLGEDFKVEKVNGFGKSGVVVTRIANSVDTSEETKYSFAGKKAKTADKESLKRAKQMEKDGANRDEIYNATGWFKGKDNKWRFEIPDNFDKIDFDKLLKNNENFFSLDKIYDNPALFAAYPQLRKVLVRSKQLKSPETYGYTNGTEITLNWSKINDEREEAGKTLVHEIQHVIQDYEKFSGGGSDSNVLSEMLRSLKLIRKEVATIPNGKKSLNPLSTAFSNARFARDMGETEILQEAEDTIKIIKKGFTPKNWEKMQYLASRYSELSDTVDNIRDAKGETMIVDTDNGEIEEPLQPHLKYEAYERLGGEQEAREVGRRLFDNDGTPTPHDDDALIIFGGNTYGMIKQSENKKKPIRNGDGELVKDGAMREIFPPSAATANGTTDYWSPASLKVTRDNKGGVGTSGNSVDTNSPKGSISQSEGEIKYSIGNDNSTESLTQKIKNKLSAYFDDSRPSARRDKRIKDTLQKITGYRILFSHTNSDETIVDDFNKLIQAKHAYEWEKLLPQIGGKIAQRLKLNPNSEQSNYIADWLLTGALNNTSAEAKNFQKAMRENPEVARLLQDVRNTFQEISDMSALERYKSKIVHKEKKPLIQRLWGERKNIIEQWFDDLHPIKRMIQKMKETATPQVAKMIDEMIDPYKMARLVRGKGALADLMIEAEKENIEAVRNAFREQNPFMKFDRLKSLAMIIEEAGGKQNLEDFEAFCIAKLDKEIYEKNRANPDGKQYTPLGTEEQADAVIKAGEKKFGAAQRSLVAYSNILLTMQFNAGLLTQKQYSAIINGWKNYVPMARVFDENEDFDFSNSLERKVGSKRDTFSPIAKLICNTQEFIGQAERNKVKLELANIVHCGGFGEILADVENRNPDVKDIITYKENGQTKYLQVADITIKRAIDSMQTKSESTWLMKTLHSTSRFMRACLTLANPDYAIGNIFRDMVDAFIHNKNLDANPFVAAMEVWRAGFREVVGKKKSQDYIDWLANGGSQSGFITEDIDTAERSINKITGNTSRFGKVLDGFYQLAEVSEYATRLNTYKTSKAKLAAKRADGKATIEDKRNAALMSRDASIDFAKAGRSGRQLNRLLLFSNAALQSLSLWGQKLSPAKLKTKEGRKEAASAVFRAVAMGIIPAILQAVLRNSDDDWKKKYKQAHDWEKDTYWIFGDVKVPKGLDLSIRLMSAFTDEVLDKMIDDDPVEFDRIKKAFIDAAPSLTATIFTPTIEAMANYSFFREAPIVPYSEQHLPKHLQYGSNTSSVAKLTGEIFGASPRKIDYLINGYFGFMGRTGSRIPDFLQRGMTLDEVPMLRRFYFNPYKNPKVVKDFYEAYDEQEELLKGYKLERQKGEKVSLPEEYDAALHKRLQAAQDTMRKISKAQKAILDNPKLSFSERQEKIQALEKRRIALCEKVFKRAQ